MKDAFGGVLSLVLITIFLVIVSGILALLVNYTKAFRMKNVVISTIEQYSGAAGCFKDGSEYGCSSKIKEEAQKFGYSPTALRCPKGYTSNFDLFCSKESNSTSGNNKVYSIITQVDINIPIINKMMGLEIFQVHGDTRTMKK